MTRQVNHNNRENNHDCVALDTILGKSVGADLTKGNVNKKSRHANHVKEYGSGVQRMLERVAEKTTANDLHWQDMRNLPVLQMMAPGLTIKGMAEAITVTESTMKTHIAHTLHELQTPNSRTAAPRTDHLNIR